ncbi:uncharacterized protein LOC131214915 isoform X2 [Anopheles bellator]|uniref:uncharacterized protein LOC131214915 isoform X2 n=1 Tax=Anopheles bellator TaxID=139047 RepID=UPI0026475A4D|nr:uncharacterized protein LOC131214915 isoform X2 [Anopheles bellator]
MGQLSTVVAALLSALAVCGGAPTATIIQPAHYYLIQPQPSTVKIQPHLIQPIQHLKLEPKQYIYYYPAALPLTATTTTTTHQYTAEGKPIRLAALKQEEGGNGNWWSSVFGFFQPPTTEMPAGEGETTEAPAAASSAPEKKLMYVAPGAPDLRVGETPASTSGLPQRYYILSGAPQFYGNFDALQNPLSPIFSLQPLQAIHARANSDIQAEDGQPKFQAQIVSALAPIAPVPAAVPAQLKNDLLESHQDKEQTIDRAWGRSLDDEQPQQQQQPEQQPLSEDEPIVVQSRSKGDDEEGESGAVRAVYDEELPKEQEPEQAMQRSVNDPAIAAAKPSGNFFEEEEDEEKKKM